MFAVFSAESKKSNVDTAEDNRFKVPMERFATNQSSLKQCIAKIKNEVNEDQKSKVIKDFTLQIKNNKMQKVEDDN